MVYVYALKDRSKVFYIGKCKDTKKRLAGHISHSFRKETPKDNLIQKMLEEGRKPSLEILKTCSDAEGFLIEMEMIKRHSTLNNILNVVHNTDGVRKIHVQILQLLAEDKDTNEIAISLFRSPRTIETLRQRIKEIAGVKTIGGLIAWAYQKEILTL